MKADVESPSKSLVRSSGKPDYRSLIVRLLDPLGLRYRLGYAKKADVQKPEQLPPEKSGKRSVLSFIGRILDPLGLRFGSVTRSGLLTKRGLKRRFRKTQGCCGVSEAFLPIRASPRFAAASFF